MPDNAPSVGADGSQSDVWSAISAFEQILEAMPDDRASLEALIEAYRQIGDLAKAREHTVRLARVLVQDRDAEAAGAMLGDLRSMAGQQPEIGPLIRQIEGLGRPGGASAPLPEPRAPPRDAQQAVRRPGFRLAEEISFAWALLEAEQMTSEEYSAVVQDLTDWSSGDSQVTVSVFHVLEARASKNLERIVGFASKRYGMPIISLSSFALKLPAVVLLPQEFAVRRGALVFSLMGRDALAVVMNPADKGVQGEVAAMAGRACHFFLTLPSEFDRALDRAAELRTQQEQASQ